MPTWRRAEIETDQTLDVDEYEADLPALAHHHDSLERHAASGQVCDSPAPDSAGVHGEQLLRVMPKEMLSKMGRASRQRSVHRPWALHRYRRQIVLLSQTCVEQTDLVQMASQSFPPSRGEVPTWRRADAAAS